MTTTAQKIIVKLLTDSEKEDTIQVGKNKTVIVVLLIKTATQYTLQINLVGSGAHAIILGCVLGKGTDQIILHTNQNHIAPDTVSDLHIKAILRDQSFFAYEGFIKIAKHAQKSNAYQRNDNLLLSDGAKAESKPALEILANDVRCTHGATLGKIDEEQLFYLESRGISKELGEKLILQGFFQVLIDKIPDAKIRDQIVTLFSDLK